MKEKRSKKESNKEEAKEEGRNVTVFASFSEAAAPQENLKIDWPSFIRFFNDTIIHNEDYLLNTYTAPVLATIPDLTAKTPKKYGYYGGSNQKGGVS